MIDPDGEVKAHKRQSATMSNPWYTKYHRPPHMRTPSLRRDVYDKKTGEKIGEVYKDGTRWVTDDGTKHVSLQVACRKLFEKDMKR